VTTPVSSEPYRGAVIAGRYQVEARIGAGAMGEVWSGKDLRTRGVVALKTLLPAAASDPGIVARFRREATLLGRLRSPHVARVVDFVEDAALGFVLVMQFVEGESLGAVLATRTLTVDEALDLAMDLSSALRDLHEAKVVHRDLKPDNVILEPPAGGRRRAVVVDFGVGRVETAPDEEAPTSITEANTAVGTLPYMAPEQLLSSATATAAADVYAMGAILFRSISGETVFGDVDDGVAARRKLVDDAPPLSIPRIDPVAAGLSSIVARALRREPEERPTAAVMLAELTALAEASRATDFDLDAPTEQAPPPGLSSAHPMGISSAASSFRLQPDGEPTRRMSRPPESIGHSIGDEPTDRSPGSPSMAAPPTTAPTGVAVRKHPDVATTLPAASDAVPDGSAGLDAASIHQTRPTVHSPIHLPQHYDPPSMVVVPTMGNVRPSPAKATLASPSPTPAALSVAEEPAARSSDHMIPLRLAVLGVLAALLLGAVLGFEGRMLLEPHPQQHTLPR
jgi:eukaryotic-like serine/threonine-protein kinase